MWLAGGRKTVALGWTVIGRRSTNARCLYSTKSKAYQPLPEGWEAIIGVEVHAQLKAKKKLFSHANTPNNRVGQQSPENTCVAPFDAALPGTLPAIQSESVRLALKAGIALECEIGKTISFDRKHYFYPDLTSGYQISQKYAPLARNGRLKLLFDDGHLSSPEDEVDVRIEQIQLEQDTAKSSHHISETAGSLTTIDLNRAGSALIEIVSGPDLRTPEQAGAYVRKLREILRRIGASDGNMDEGSLRCDVNVSVHRTGEPWGVRCEVKNVNSVRFVMNAIISEMHRQQKLLSAGELVEQETRGYNELDGSTVRLRSKEDAPDYRYMPDPNLPPLRIGSSFLEEIREELPELPAEQRSRLMQQYGVGLRDTNVLMRIGLDDDADVSTAERASDAVAYYEQVAEGRDGQMVMNWIIHELLKTLNAQEKSFAQNPIQASDLGDLLDLVQNDKVTKATAKAFLSELIKTEGKILTEFKQENTSAVQACLESRNALALDSGDALVSVCKEVVEALPDAVEAVRSGNKKVMQRLVGEVMKRTKGRANAKVANQILDELVHPK
ncbi:Glutamyl-tRNA amidotransferase B subunit [Meira miltonrushii]|uniref:Glutamyl-tRNA(Gln) amidotransferase subunit B, mitochondrial n=1 Tax=Meira miltonrushii TaxID=1280837 RepID=A0A316VFY0_9BASI|nr:Glutamyl-tRNA amidotransferase B subunit [Meira miltonrushii]PWN35223.1 Glutamyl-tRNA amidotransferase B subunit [Meira miltonrushii]